MFTRHSEFHGLAFGASVARAVIPLTRIRARTPAERLSRPCPKSSTRLISLACFGARTSFTIALMSAIAVVAPWAARGEIPPAAQIPGHYVTTDQFGLLIVIMAAINLVPVIDAVRRWLGFGQARQIQSPLEVRAANEFVPRGEFDKLAAEISAERKQHTSNVTTQHENTQRQIDYLANSIRDEFREAQRADAERHDALHSRITALLGPIEATRQRLNDHIQDRRAHVKGEPA